MKKRLSEIDFNEYKSIRYLNLFRLLLAFFFFSIIYKPIIGVIGFSYTQDIARLIATLYLFISILIWIASVIYKNHSTLLGKVALVIDLPCIISLTLLIDGIDKGWVILPVITIGSFAMLSRRPYAIFLMPVVATILLWILPSALGIKNSEIQFSDTLLYALTYFGIALLGIRQSLTYSQSLLLTQKQKQKITNLSTINELVIDQMKSGVVVFDKNYRILQINKKAQETIQSKRNKLLPALLIKKLISLKSSPSNSININIHGDELLIDVIQHEKGSEINIIQIDQQTQINEKAQQINLATMGQLSATIAHELRNPMAAIYSAAQLLEESENFSNEDAQLTGIITKQIERSNRIIEDVLLMSKPHIANKTEFNLNQKLKKFILEYCQQNHIEKDNITLEIAKSAINICFDSTHLTQLFWNLADNALKHGQGDKFSIAVSNQENSVLIDFKNKGAEFETLVEESLFTPFFTTHTQGTGLGLYICREMCRSNNAKLEYLHQDFYHVFRIHVKK